MSAALHHMDNREMWMARTLVDLTDTLGATFDLQTLAAMLVERCAAVVGTPEVGMLLYDQAQQLQVVHTSTERVRVLQTFEIDNREGLAIECIETGTPTVNLPVDGIDPRWPRFGPMTRAMGYRTLHVLPLRLRDEVIGAIELCDTSERVLPDLAIELSQAMADSTTIGILHERMIRRYAVLSQQLQIALDSRVLIEQAKGVMSERLGVSIDDAFQLLRRFARNHNMTLSSVARAAIDGELTPNELRRAIGRSFDNRRPASRGRA